MRRQLFILPALLCALLGNCTEGGKNKTVALQALGDVPSVYLDSLAASIHSQYGFQVISLEAVDMPEAFFVNVKSPRYRADSLLVYLNRIKPSSCSFILGVTMSDISCTKRDAQGEVLKPESRYSDWGVFGLGQRPGSACVISSFRLPKEQTAQYLVKVGLHELGHNFGLPHCMHNDRCVMRDAAEKLSTLDQVDKALCDRCRETVPK